MSKVNIVIIGAHGFHENINIDTLNNYKNWNNVDQASYYDMSLCIDQMRTQCNIRNINIYCIDPQYYFTVHNKDIHYINDYFKVGDTAYCRKSGHTIFVEFCNLLDEYYVTKPYDVHAISEYNNYKISWISCGCSWNQAFPTDLIIKLVQEHIYTPTDITCPHSYMFAYNFNKSKDNDALFQPFCQGLYHILGTFLWRGYKDNHEYERVLLEFIPKLLDVLDVDVCICNECMQHELRSFISQDMHWNALQRSTREKINNLVFGKLIIIS